MKPKSFDDMRCSIARALEHVGSWWSLLIVRDAMMGATRFSQFERSLGIAKATLASRLGELVASGVLQRVPAGDGGRHDEYRLTEKGRDIAPVLIALAQWGDKWAEHECGRSFAFLDRQTGEEISRIRPRRSDGSPIPPHEILLQGANKGAQR